ncbi:unnamed protein product [Lampetra planeri]
MDARFPREAQLPAAAPHGTFERRRKGPRRAQPGDDERASLEQRRGACRENDARSCGHASAGSAEVALRRYCSLCRVAGDGSKRRFITFSRNGAPFVNR